MVSPLPHPASLVHQHPSPSLAPSFLCIHLPVDPRTPSHNSTCYSLHNASHPLILSAHHSSHLAPLCFSSISSSLAFSHLLMHSIHLCIECLFFYIILPLCHSLPAPVFFPPFSYFIQCVPAPPSTTPDNLMALKQKNQVPG